MILKYALNNSTIILLSIILINLTPNKYMCQEKNSKTTGVYNIDDGVMSTIQSEETEQLQGYPQANEINGRAISLYNDATELIYEKPDLAISYYKEAIEIEPKFIQAIDNLGKVYRIIEKYDLAEKLTKNLSPFSLKDLLHILI